MAHYRFKYTDPWADDEDGMGGDWHIHWSETVTEFDAKDDDAAKLYAQKKIIQPGGYALGEKKKRYWRELIRIEEGDSSSTIIPHS